MSFWSALRRRPEEEDYSEAFDEYDYEDNYSYEDTAPRWENEPAQPIRSAADRDALLEGVQDGTIDVIATDHAPHTAEEKSRGLAGSAMGVVGLETSFAVIYTKLVRTGIITPEKMIDLMSEAPRRIFSLGGGLAEGEAADIAVFDTDREFAVDPATFLSKGRSTPFEGWRLRGDCVLTMSDGRIVYER